MSARKVRGVCCATLVVLTLGLALPAGAERPNVLIISIDSLRRDALGCYGARLPHAPGLSPSPNLDRLAAAGVRMDDAYAPSPWTLPSHEDRSASPLAAPATSPLGHAAGGAPEGGEPEIPRRGARLDRPRALSRRVRKRLQHRLPRPRGPSCARRRPKALPPAPDHARADRARPASRRRAAREARRPRLPRGHSRADVAPPRLRLAGPCRPPRDGSGLSHRRRVSRPLG